MLSTNSSVSAPVESRNHSAIVRADRATRRRAPGGSFIWPKTMAVCAMTDSAGVADLGLLHFEPEVVALAGPLADAGEDRVAAVLALAMRAISSVRMTVLPRPAPPNRPALPPRTSGVSRSMTLMPVSNTSVLGDSSANGGGSRWIGRRSVASTGPRPSIGSPSRLKTRPSVSLPTGTVHRRAGVDDVHAADQAVGRAEGDAADAVAAEVLLHLAGQVDRDALVLGVDRQGVVDLGQVPFVELGVERRADDLDDLADVLAVRRCAIG